MSETPRQRRWGSPGRSSGPHGRGRVDCWPLRAERAVAAGVLGTASMWHPRRVDLLPSSAWIDFLRQLEVARRDDQLPLVVDRSALLVCWAPLQCVNVLGRVHLGSSHPAVACTDSALLYQSDFGDARRVRAHARPGSRARGTRDRNIGTLAVPLELAARA